MSATAAGLGGIVLVWSAALAIPGPDLLALSLSLSGGRRCAFLAVVGITCGTALWGLACLCGLTVIFATAPWAFVALRWIGAAYLAMLGLNLLRSRGSQDARGPLHDPIRCCFCLGLGANLSNPKTVLFLASLMAGAPGAEAAVVALTTAISALGYGALATAGATRHISEALARHQITIRRFAGGLFLLLAVMLIAQA